MPLKVRTSTSKSRETERPWKWKPSEKKLYHKDYPTYSPRTSKPHETSFSNPAFEESNLDEERIDVNESKTLIQNSRQILNEQIRQEVKRYFPEMTDSVEVKQLKTKGLSVRLFGGKKK